MNAQDLVDLYERCEAAERTLRHLGYSYVQGAEFWKLPVRNNHKWLQENTLIYRLTDDVRPVNCDEINVTMADGSRSMEKRTERATEILNLLQGVSRVTVENPLGLKKFSALEFINTDEELDAYVAEQVDEAIKAHTAGAATPAAPAPVHQVNYSVLYMYAERKRVDYNDLCATVHEAMDRAARAPAGSEVTRLRAALVYTAYALHATPQYMLAEGITLIDGDTVRVSRDGWTVEASVNPARAAQPAQQGGA